MSTSHHPGWNRRQFAAVTIAAGMAGQASAAPAATANSQVAAAVRRIRTGVIGCGSVSNAYLPVLAHCPFVELVSLCDIRHERARKQAEKYTIEHHYPDIEAMLAGEPFDYLVDLTDMQEHEKVNRRALQAGKHVWSEKPIANSLAAGQALLRLEIITAARDSSSTGAHVKLRSTFRWPLVGP